MAAGLVSEMVDSITDLTNWGQLEIPNDQADAFNDPRRVFLEGYFEHFDDNFKGEFIPDQKVSVTQFNADDVQDAEMIFSSLVHHRYITGDGRITPPL